MLRFLLRPHAIPAFALAALLTATCLNASSGQDTLPSIMPPASLPPPNLPPFPSLADQFAGPPDQWQPLNAAGMPVAPANNPYDSFLQGGDGLLPGSGIPTSGELPLNFGSTLDLPLPPTDSPNPDNAKRNHDGPPPDAMGFGDMGGRGMGEGFGGGLHPSDAFRYSVVWYPTVQVKGQSADYEQINESLSMTHPLWSDVRNSVSITSGVRNVLIDSDAVLPETGQIIPNELWSANLGLRYAHEFDNGWLGSGGLSVGSASDHPFASIREMNVGTNFMLRVPSGESNAWIFSLMYSPLGELNFPIPGVAYSWNPSPEFHANIGIPFQINWRPTDDWQFQASYMLLRTIHVKSTYRFSHAISAFAAYDWSNESYILLDRPEENDRFFIYDQRVSMGLQLAVIDNWTSSLSAGYIFDRYFFEGTSFSSANGNQVDLGAGPFASLNLGVRY